MNVKRAWFLTSLASLLLAALVVTGCKDRQVEAALDTDANGYICRKCQTKFYTDREVFAGHCPQCKSPEIDTVLGFVCPKDQHVTYGARSRGSVACEKCRSATSGMTIPTESQLKAWGAPKKAASEIGG